MDYREATAGDVEAIAALHADSWRRHYRGAYLDSYLDGDVFADLRTVWTDRLTRPTPDRHTVVADLGGTVAGFAHTIFDVDQVWGAYLDNLHVRHDLKRQGIGARLLADHWCPLCRAASEGPTLSHAKSKTVGITSVRVLTTTDKTKDDLLRWQETVAR